MGHFSTAPRGGYTNAGGPHSTDGSSGWGGGLVLRNRTVSMSPTQMVGVEEDTMIAQIAAQEAATEAACILTVTTTAARCALTSGFDQSYLLIVSAWYFLAQFNQQ